MLVYPSEIQEYEPEDDIPDYPVTLFFTKEGYFKKITPQSAVSGALNGYEFVITTSTQPVEAGKLVRLANNS